MKEVVFKLFPQGVITGHVIDEDGEPLANAAVQCMRVGYQCGKRQLLPAGGARANDLGEYRVRELAAGRYYVSASYRAQDMFISTTSEWLMGGAAEDAYGPTYYPNTTEANSAAPIEITPGTQVEGIDLRLVRIRTVHIRGRIVNLPSGRSGDAHVQLLPRDTGAGHGSPSRVPVVGREGTFEVRGVTQGSYFLLAGYSDADVQLIARVPIEIETSNVDNVELALAPGGEISGRLVIEGNANSNTNDATTPTGATNRPHAPGKLHGLHGGRRPVRGVYWACQMDVHAVLTALYAERKRVERAIARLEARRRATLPTQSRFGSSRRIDRFL